MFRFNYGSSTDVLRSCTECGGVISAERFGWTMEGSWYDVKQLSHTFLEALTKFKKNLCKRPHIRGQELNKWPYRFEVEMFKFHFGFWYFSTKIFVFHIFSKYTETSFAPVSLLSCGRFLCLSNRWHFIHQENVHKHRKCNTFL
jgi:hypothetical protein